MTLTNEKQNLPPPKFLQIKQEDKTFARLLSKEQNLESINHQRRESSFRVMYYGGATGSIPFRWESRPGTPKHALFSDTCSLPPLTPPPSYQFSPKIHVSKSQEKGTQKSKKSHTILSKFASSSRKTNITTISSSSTYSLSSSCSNSSSSYSSTSRKDSVPPSISPIYFGLEDDNNNDYDNDDHHHHGQEPTRARSHHRQSLTFCFGSTNNGQGCRRLRGDRHLEVKSFRRGFLSIFATHAECPEHCWVTTHT
ncbi:hypothetical protein LIER_20672 [Lithospermum erythrorhizon]|uniref:Uncharacterized protein n=1 Tax=Lithospermum erythrorhizon TaxID=34254 RepID=A0AAV3QRF9_LITER